MDLSLPRGYIHIYDNYFIFSEPAWPIKAKFHMKPPLGSGNTRLCKWSRSHDQDGRHAHIWHMYGIHMSPSLNPLGKSMPNFISSLFWVAGTHGYVNGPGHMTKMATMHIYGKTI